ncbi:MAG: hypothetical protein CMLOHMNK_01455 [Steroidobacteraceae bacterium]|nr:hypothetical protein [Steroidobacteraceae bacterium]
MRAEGAQCLWADWDDLAVLYHRPSGKTHFVNAATAFLLELFIDAPVTLDAATRALAAEQGRPVDADLGAHVADTVERLLDVGLIERA